MARGRGEGYEEVVKRVIALVLIAAAGASCGGNDADKRVFAQRQAICSGLVAKNKTVGQADADFRATGLDVSHGNGSAINCQDFVPPPGSQCPSGTLCEIFYQSSPTDQSSCGTNGCVYACVAYTAGQSSNDVSDATGICGTQFISGQPFLF